MNSSSIVSISLQLLLLLTVARQCFTQNTFFHIRSQPKQNTFYESLRSPAFYGCEKNAVPSPALNKTIKSYVINLDLHPKQRWIEVIKDKKYEILALLASVKANTDAWFGKKVFDLVEEYFPKLAHTLPPPYSDELQGMAEAINATLGDVTLFNVFYEFFTVCTSIIAQTPEGNMYHARNLDFGLFLGWDGDNKTWLTTERLRPLVVELDFQRNNKTLFKSISFAGFLGVLTGMKPGKFSLTINERFKLNGGFIGVVEWIIGLHNQQWISFLTRTVMENCDNYTAAQKMLAKTHLVSPVYFILSGMKPNQGCVITRGRKNFDIKSMSSETGPWFLVQTNYDHWTTPPFYDNRRTPATTCLNSSGNMDLSKTLFNVLSTRPVLNKLTVYTTIIKNNEAEMSTWIQDCQDPCWPW